MVTTGTEEMFLVTISSMTSRTVLSILHLTISEYVPSLMTLSGFLSMSVSLTFIEMNFSIRYCVMTLVTMVRWVSESYETSGIRRARDISCLRRAS